MSDDHDDLVVAARFESVGAAQAAALRLEADGIRSMVGERDAFRLDPFRKPQRAAIRLLVLRRDLAAARESLEDVVPDALDEDDEPAPGD